MFSLLSISVASSFRMPLQDNVVFWKTIGFCALVLFNGRWIVQWIQSELKKESHVPVSFWWQSMIGALLYTLYGLQKQDSVFIVAYGTALIPCIRNLILIYRKRRLDAAGGAGKA